MSDIQAETFHLQGGEIIRQVTFGMNDGVVSTFALLAGLAGAGQEPTTILVTLLAAAVAGALSMAAGEFISGKSERDYYNHETEQERLEIKLCPEIEKEELRRIYLRKGFRGDVLDQIVETISRNEDLWVREMIIDELGNVEIEQRLDIRPAGVIFVAFILGASFPVLPYVFLARTGMAGQTVFAVATGITVCGLFLAGALKRFVTGVNWLKSGLEMLAVGFFAYGVSYLIGTLFPDA